MTEKQLEKIVTKTTGMTPSEYLESVRPKVKPQAILFAIKHKEKQEWLGSLLAGHRRTVDNLYQAAFHGSVGPLNQILRRRGDRDRWVIVPYEVKEM